MNKIFKLILTGLAIAGAALLMSPSVKIDLKEITWVDTKQVQKMGVYGVSSAEMLSGDSIILYKGDPAILEDIYFKYTYLGTAYTTTGSTDTVKICGLYGDTAVTMAYIVDGSFEATNNHVSYIATEAGGVTGTLYYLIIPASKFTVGNSRWELMCKYTIFRQ